MQEWYIQTVFLKNLKTRRFQYYSTFWENCPGPETRKRILNMVQVILDYSVQTLVQELDFKKLTDLVDEDLRILLEEKKICKDIEELFQLSYMERIEADYEVVNGEYGIVCPVCMKENLFSNGEGEVDHYFPRKKYPALAIHRLNFLPICGECNGPRRKHTKNPVASSDMGPGELLTVFLPYLRAGKDEIEFRVSEDARRYIVMEPRDKGDGYAQKRIDNMERLFMLGSRWSTVFSYVYEDIRAELNQERTEGRTREERLAILRSTMAANSNSTKNRKDFMKGVYCSWLLEKRDEELEEMFLTPGPERMEH